MELTLWKGDYGLPSIDRSCLTALAYCKFSEVPLTVRTTKLPPCSVSLPVFTQNGESISDVEQIFSHLRKQNRGTDHTLSPKQSADNFAYTALIQDKLLPGLEQTLWVDNNNYTTFTRTLYANALLFPLGMVIPSSIHKAKVTKLHATHAGYMNAEDRENKIYKDAKECLNILSTVLGEQDYFFGKSPTSLDAVVFGHLAPLLKFPLPNPVLQNHLKACSNLTSFCNRILEKYFPLTKQEEEALRKAEEERRKAEQEKSDFPHKTRNIIIASVVAISAMAVYAIMAGIIEIEVTDAEKADPIPD